MSRADRKGGAFFEDIHRTPPGEKAIARWQRNEETIERRVTVLAKDEKLFAFEKGATMPREPYVTFEYSGQRYTRPYSFFSSWKREVVEQPAQGMLEGLRDYLRRLFSPGYDANHQENLG